MAGLETLKKSCASLPSNVCQGIELRRKRYQILIQIAQAILNRKDEKKRKIQIERSIKIKDLLTDNIVYKHFIVLTLTIKSFVSSLYILTFFME